YPEGPPNHSSTPESGDLERPPDEQSRGRHARGCFLAHDLDGIVTVDSGGSVHRQDGTIMSNEERAKVGERKEARIRDEMQAEARHREDAENERAVAANGGVATNPADIQTNKEAPPATWRGRVRSWWNDHVYAPA